MDASGAPSGRRLLRGTLLAFAAAMALLQLVSAFAPIAREAHNWRQSDVYSVALNYQDRGVDLLRPRIDFWRGPTQIVGMEAPVLPALTHLAMFVVGEHPRSARLVNVLFGLFAIVFAAHTWLRSSEDGGLGAACVMVAAALSPMALQELRQIQPDALSASLTLIASALFMRGARSGRKRDFAAAVGIYSVATVTKSPVLTAAPALFLLSWIERPPPRAAILRRGLMFLVPLAAAAAWTLWAARLTHAHEVLSPYFHLDFTVAEVTENLVDPERLKHALAYVLGGYAVSWLLWPSLLTGALLSLRAPERRRGIAMLVWLAGGLVFCLAFSHRSTVHLYYGMVLLGPGLYLASRGLSNVLAPAEDWLSRGCAAGVFVGLVASPWLAARSPRFGDGATGASWAHTWFLTAGARWGVVAVLTGLVLATLRKRAPTRVEAALGALAVAWGIGWALPGELGYFKYTTDYAEWQTFDAAEAPMRAAIAAHTTRDDLFFVDGYTPWYLYRASRRGFSVAPDADVDALACKTTQGIEYYLHFSENGAVVFPGRRLERIARGPRFELSRIVPPMAGQCSGRSSNWPLMTPLSADSLWPGRAVQLVSRHAHTCMAATTASAGAALLQATCQKNEPGQRFHVRSSTAGVMLALDGPSALCVTAADSAGPDHPLTLTQCTGRADQRLDVKKAAPDTYYLAVHDTQNVIDATPTGGVGRPIHRYRYHGGPCQRWRFEPLPP